MEKVRGREGAPCDRDKYSLGIHQEETGDGRGVGAPATNIRGLCKRNRVRGQGEGAIAVAASDSCGKASESHAKETLEAAWERWRRESDRIGEGNVGTEESDSSGAG